MEKKPVKKLYDMLISMELAAENDDIKKVQSLNLDFSQEYQHLYGNLPYEEGTFQLLFDRARNKCLLAIQKAPGRPLFERQIREEGLKEARDYIKKIRKKIDS